MVKILKKLMKHNIFLSKRYKKLDFLEKITLSYDINKDWLDGFYIGFALGNTILFLYILHWWGFI